MWIKQKAASCVLYPRFSTNNTAPYIHSHAHKQTHWHLSIYLQTNQIHHPPGRNIWWAAVESWPRNTRRSQKANCNNNKKSNLHNTILKHFFFLMHFHSVFPLSFPILFLAAGPLETFLILLHPTPLLCTNPVSLKFFLFQPSWTTVFLGGERCYGLWKRLIPTECHK